MEDVRSITANKQKTANSERANSKAFIYGVSVDALLTDNVANM